MTQTNKEKRTQYLPAVRVTGQELETAKAKANEAGLFFSEYARSLLLSGGSVSIVRSTHKKENVETVRALSAIGNNLNQIARSANIHGGLDPENNERLAELLPAIEKLIDRFIDGS